jgi:hypothetical protein
MNFLPGVPLEEIEDDSLSQALKLPQNFVKHIIVNLIFEQGINDALIKEAEEKVSEFVGLNAVRGDRILTKKMVFRRSVPEKLISWQKVVSSHFAWLLGVLLLGIFLFGPFRSFLRNLTSAVEVFRVRADTRITTQAQTEMPANPAAAGLTGPNPAPPENPKSSAPPSEQEMERKHFDFLNQNNLSNLMYILKSESTDTIAIVLDYLPPSLTSQVLEGLDYPVREEVIMKMMNIKQYSQENVKGIENALKEKVEYLLGGPDHMGEILNLVDDETREKILKSTQEKDPILGKQLKKMIVSFEEIYQLNLEGLQQLIRRVGLANFAMSLKNEDPEKVSKLLEKLSKGAAEMLQQEMDLTKTTDKKIKLSKKLAVSNLQRLIKEGAVVRPAEPEPITAPRETAGSQTEQPGT